MTHTKIGSDLSTKDSAVHVYGFYQFWRRVAILDPREKNFY